MQENNLGASRGETSKPNPSEVSYSQLVGLGGAVSCPSRGSFGAPLQKLNDFLRCYRLAYNLSTFGAILLPFTDKNTIPDNQI